MDWGIVGWGSVAGGCSSRGRYGGGGGGGQGSDKLEAVLSAVLGAACNLQTTSAASKSLSVLWEPREKPIQMKLLQEQEYLLVLVTL